MKTLILSFVFIAAIGLWGSLNAQTQDPKTKSATEQVQTQTPQAGFVDSNGDGVCDNYDGTRPGKGLGPGNGQGKGRGNGKGLGRHHDHRSGKGLGQGQRLRDGSGPRCQQVKPE